MKTPILEDIVIPAACAGITGLLAGWLAQSVGWAGVPVGLAAALAAWLLRPGAVVLPTLPESTPQPTRQEVRIDILSQDGKQGDYLTLGITPAQLAALAAGLAAGKTLTTRQWTGQGAVFSQAEFARLRSELIGRGLARWVSDRDPRSGCMLTSKGSATFRGLAALPQPPAGLQSSKIDRTVKHAHTATQQGQPWKVTK